MVLQKFVLVENEFFTIAKDKTAEKKYTFDKEAKLKRIFIVSSDGATLYRMDTTIKIEEEPITKPRIPASIVGADIMVSPVLDLHVRKDDEIIFGFTNKTGADREIGVVLELHEYIT